MNLRCVSVLLDCVTPEVVLVLQVIIALCFIVIIISLSACVMDVFGPTNRICRAIRYTASLAVLSGTAAASWFLSVSLLVLPKFYMCCATVGRFVIFSLNFDIDVVLFNPTFSGCTRKLQHQVAVKSSPSHRVRVRIRTEVKTRSRVSLALGTSQLGTS